MHVHDAIRTAAKRSGTPMIAIGPKLGHDRAYVSAMVTTGRMPRTDTLAGILGACGYQLCAVPRGKVPRNAIPIDSQ